MFKQGLRYTFADLERTSNQLAGWLAKQGMKEGQVVALVMQNKPEYVAWWLAMMKLGIKIAMINHQVMKKGLVHCIKVARLLQNFLQAVRTMLRKIANFC